jgi:amidase
VRVPAACCGVTGLKTAYGRISVKGVYPLAPSLDTVGPLGADVAAVELGMRLLEPGFTAPDAPAALIAGRLTVTGLPGGIDPAIDAAVDRALAAAGVSVAALPAIDVGPLLEAAGVIIDSEGFRVNAYLMQYLKQLSPHVRRNLERGARLGRGDRAAADRARAAVRATFEALLADSPVLVLPTLASTPPLLGARGFALTALTVPANLAGLPALSLPVPAADGVIASLQVIGGSEEQVVAFGRVIEAALAG